MAGLMAGDRGAGGVWLRWFAGADLAALYEMQCDPAANAMAGTKPRTREAFIAVWERSMADPGTNSRVIEVGSAGGPVVAGSISCFVADGHPCVGYWIAREFWGKGIASRALALFLEEERRRPLRATTARENAASRRVLERCGFRCVGFGVGEETERYVAGEIAEFELE